MTSRVPGPVHDRSGALDTSFSGDGKQTTDFGRNPIWRPGAAARRQDRGGGPHDGVNFRYFALVRYNRTARSTRASPATAESTTDFFGGDGRWSGGPPAGREDRASADRASRRRSTLCARPLQRQRHSRHHLRWRRQAVDRLRWLLRQRDRWRCRPMARSSWSDTRAATSRSPATTRTARPIPPSPATAGRRRLGAPTGDGVAVQANGKIVVAGDDRQLHRFALARYNAERHARHELLRRRQADDRLRRRGSDGARGVALQADGKIVVVGPAGRHPGASTSPSPATTRTASLDTTFAGDGKQTTDFGGADDAAELWRSRPTARSSSSAKLRAATSATSPSPATTRTARSTRASPATAS